MTDKSVLNALLFAAAGFCSGSVLYCVYLPLLFKGMDITKLSEDQNPGTHNAFAHAGVPLGILCLFCELGKGYVPVALSLRVIDPASPLFALVMLSPVLGHAFSPLRRFHGGKGIAASFGVLLALAPKHLVVLVLAAAYLVSLVLPLHPNEKRTVAAFTAFALIAMLTGGVFSIRLGCLLIALLVGWRNWADAKISIPLLERGEQ
ncbi:MAG TPA: glycerol-3-phosphate acyltransferase [Eubacteriales bacterium]|nr:glycerol-3-phosphate acyltransferase [Eubacteriales bacterium]